MEKVPSKKIKVKIVHTKTAFFYPDQHPISSQFNQIARLFDRTRQSVYACSFWTSPMLSCSVWLNSVWATYEKNSFMCIWNTSCSTDYDAKHSLIVYKNSCADILYILYLNIIICTLCLCCFILNDAEEVSYKNRVRKNFIHLWNAI